MSRVQPGVFPIGLDPIDLTRPEKRNLAPCPNHEAVDRPLIEQGQQPAFRRTRERFAKPLRLDGLEQIVDGVHVERFDGVLVVGGDKDTAGSHSVATASSTSKPLRSGICTSRNTSSGRCARIISTASRPPLHSPTTVTPMA